MKSNSANRTIAILFIAIILPIGIFTYIQLDNLKENEKVLAKVQHQQLETIIFSINQYSDDVMKSLLLKLENISSLPSLTFGDILKKYPGIDEVIIANEDAVKFLSQDPFLSSEEVLTLMAEHKETIDKLREYKQVGFSKLEPLSVYTTSKGDYHLLVFIIEDLLGQQSICFLLIDAHSFVENFLSPTMQKLAANNYIISAVSTKNNQIVYATDSTQKQSLEALPMWLLPDHELQILLKGDSADVIANKRYQLNLLWTVILITALLFGFIIIVRNLRKEMQLVQLKSDFVSNVSHEIRTPLALINMFAETLILGRVKDESKKIEYYEIISKETSRLKNIVNKILNFSQMESKKRTFSLIPTQLDDIVKETVKTYSYHLNNEGFKYEELYGAGDSKAAIDQEALMEAIINLVDNAMKYSEKDKCIKIETGKTGKYVFLKIKDKGVGISPKDQRLIFDKFFRVTQGELYKVNGAGLGLSITQNIIEAHHGKIDLESEIGRGSTFTITLPII